MCALVDLSGTIERISWLDVFAKDNDFKHYIPKLAGDIRVSSCYIVIQQILFSFPLLKIFFEGEATGSKR